MTSKADEARRLARAATKGPWRYDSKARGTEESPGLYTEADVSSCGAPSPIFTSTAFWSHGDGEFAAWARNNLEAMADELDAHRAELATRDATIARLAEALEPFARAARRFDEPSSGPLQWSDSNGFSTRVRLTVGQLRHARAALSARETEGE